jgi:hypothetical protein
MMQAALVLPETTVGMTPASATRKPKTPFCRRRMGADAADCYVSGSFGGRVVRRALASRGLVRSGIGPPDRAAARYQFSGSFGIH